MGFENYSMNNDLRKKALELEEQNAQIEAMPHGAEREIQITQADQLNTELDRLEKLTGASGEEILKEYEKLNIEMARQGIDTLLKELRLMCTEEERAALGEEMNSGNLDTLLATVKKYFPIRAIFITACVLVITSSTWAKNASANQTGEHIVSASHISLKVENVNTKKEMSVLAEAEIMVQDANNKAKDVINNVEGFIKSLAQKEIIDEVAKNSDGIIAYLNNTSSELPALNGRAADLINVYTDAVKRIDSLGNEKASQKIRAQLIKKIEIVASLDYAEIKKALS